jgi:DNA invertase Pin-like site-specific DNA recombinase
MERTPVMVAVDLPGSEAMLRAAQYVRMSSDRQKYSPENQKDAISAYAARRGFAIVRTYSDEGRSGLNIEGRAALQRLIDDVKSGNTDYRFILVYDVSRWGRFQDADESAYYEFICKEAGIQVLYCAELFENDGSLVATMLKAQKRAMAAEFVRELSTKVFIGQSRIARLGFWRGGFPAYGLRRLLVDDHGNAKCQLEIGQWKSIQTDRIIVIHGPANEVETVRRIFKSFVGERKNESQIAAELNADGLRTLLGNRWEPESITKMLVNESYLGHIIFNRTSVKLKGRLVHNPPDMWIRRDNAFLPIIEEAQFRKVKQILFDRRQIRSADSLVQRLASLHAEQGYLTVDMIDADPDLPSAETLRRHYGSLVNAYKLIDYRPARLLRRSAIAEGRRSIVASAATDIAKGIVRIGGEATIDGDKHIIRIEDEFSISICAALATPERLGRLRWYVQADRHAPSDLTLVLRLDLTNSKIDACYLVPTADLKLAKRRRISITDQTLAGACRYDELDALCLACVGLEKGQSA